MKSLSISSLFVFASCALIPNYSYSDSLIKRKDVTKRWSVIDCALEDNMWSFKLPYSKTKCLGYKNTDYQCLPGDIASNSVFPNSIYVPVPSRIIEVPSQKDGSMESVVFILWKDGIKKEEIQRKVESYHGFKKAIFYDEGAKKEEYKDDPTVIGSYQFQDLAAIYEKRDNDFFMTAIRGLEKTATSSNAPSSTPCPEGGESK